MKNPKVSIIIPNFNGVNLLQVCLPSVQCQTYKDFEVIIIDNGSSDGSVAYVLASYPKFKVVKLKKNLGFAAAVNIGIQASRSDYVVLINNDTEVDKNCLKFFVDAANKHKEVSMIAAKMLKMDQPGIIDSAGDYIDTSGHAQNIGMGEKDSAKFNKAGYVFLVNGGGSLFKRQIFDKVGLFDEDYFAYFEDVDLCLRAQFLGFKGYFEPRAVIYHAHKATSSRFQSFTEYLQFKNMTMTIIKDFPKCLLYKDLNWLKIILVNFNTIKFLASCGYLIQALKAQGWILLNMFELLKKRRKIQSKIKVSDDYILQNFVPKKIKLVFGICI